MSNPISEAKLRKQHGPVTEVVTCGTCDRIMAKRFGSG
jgi:hypothetical protein